MEGIGFRDRIQEFETRNAQVLGISRDSVGNNAAFAQKYQFPYPLLSDTNGTVCRTYNVCPDADTGRVKRNTFVIGPDGKIRRVYDNVTPEGHIDEVLAFLEIDKPEQEQVAVMVDQLSDVASLEVIASKGNGENEYMDEHSVQSVENGRDSVVDEQNGSNVVNRSVPDLTAAAVNPATTTTTPRPIADVLPSQIEAAQPSSSPQLVFALGTLGVDFGREARRDSIMQHNGNPNDPAKLLAYFEENPDQAAAVIWTLNLDATTIYAVMPHGPYASTVYERLRQFLGEQLNEGVERVSIPGIIAGQVRLISGQTVPVIVPEPRCMYSWTTAALLEAVTGKPPSKPAKADEHEAYARNTEGVANFLRRVYDELRNLGITSQERALNYAGANVANANNIFASALERNLELHSIDVVSSPICRPDSDCWDVKLLFFDPENILRAKTVYRFTVDVSDVCPVMVGEVRSWSIP